MYSTEDSKNYYLNVYDKSRKYKINRFIHASSIYANSKDGGFYRSSKKAAEEYIEEYKNIYNLKNLKLSPIGVLGAHATQPVVVEIGEVLEHAKTGTSVKKVA